MSKLTQQLKMHAAFGVAASIALTPIQSQAITVRGDKAPGGIADFWDTQNTFSASGNLMSKVGNVFSNSCSVTLINARTAVTAAHCLINDNTRNYVDLLNGEQIVSFDPDSSSKSNANGANDANITGFIAHPGYRTGGPTENASDIAIISLDKRMDNITVVRLPDQKTAVGANVFIVGYGTSGSIGVDPSVDNGGDLVYQGEDNRRRVVTNIVDVVGPITAEQAAASPLLGADWVNEPAIIFDVDDPNNPRAWWKDEDDPNDQVTDLEGGTGGGDSGGGMFELINGETVLVGVASQGGPLDGTKPDGADSSVMQHVEVLAFRDWLEANNPLKTTSWTGGDGFWVDPGRWGNGKSPQNGSVSCNADEANTNCFRHEYHDVKVETAGKVTVASNDANQPALNAEVDSIAINNAGAEVVIANGSTLTTIGNTTVTTGVLDADGTLVAKQIDIAKDGFLKGSGTVSGPVNLSGRMAANEGLTINGNLTMGNDGILTINMSDNSDTPAQVTGDLDISNGTLLATLDANANGDKFDRRVIGANGTITGQFANVILPSPFFTHQIRYLANEIQLLIERDIDAGLNDLSASSRAFLEKLIQLNDGSNPEMANILNQFAALSANDAEQALQTLQGNGLSNSSLSTLSVIRSLNSVISQVRGAQSGGSSGSGLQLAYFPDTDLASNDPENVITQAFGGEETAASKGIWFKLFGGYGTFDGTNGANDAIVQSGGVQAGVFFESDATRQYGIYAGYTASNNSPDGLGDETTGDHYNIGAYADLTYGDYKISGSASYIYARQESLRFVNVGGFNNTAQADFNSHTLTGAATVAKTFVKEEVQFSPYFGGELIASWTDGYTETGAGAANLTVDESNNVDAFVMAGVTVSSQAKDMNGWAVRTELKLGARAEVTNPDSEFSANIAGQSFTTVSANTGRASFDLGMGLIAKKPNGLETQLRYDGQFNAGYNTHTITGEVRVPLN